MPCPSRAGTVDASGMRTHRPVVSSPAGQGGHRRCSSNRSYLSVAQGSIRPRPRELHKLNQDGGTPLPPRKGPTNQGFEACPSKGLNRHLRLTELGTTTVRAFEPDLELTSSRAPHSSCSRPTRAASRGIPSRESFRALGPNRTGPSPA
jgi:hypothetical protein